VEGFSREHFLIGQKLSRQNWQSACYRASLIKTFTQYRTTKRIKEQNQQTQTSKSCSISHYFMHFSHVPPTQYCKYIDNTYARAEDSVSGKMKVKRMSSVSCFFPDVPSIVTTLRWSRGKSGCWGNPSCGFVDPWWAIVRTAESSTARESRLLVHFKGTNQFVERLLPATTCLRKMAWGFEQIYSRVSPYLRSLYPSIATSLLAKVSHMSFYTKLITEQQSNHVREIGSIHEDYNRVAATVTAVSIWINRNKKDKVISAIRNSHD
jgi:hypothetical protein